jgi:hypothetical protein
LSFEPVFEKENSPSTLPKFFAFVCRGQDTEINKIREFIEKETKCKIIYQCRSKDYLKIVPENTADMEKLLKEHVKEVGLE